MVARVTVVLLEGTTLNRTDDVLSTMPVAAVVPMVAADVAGHPLSLSRLLTEVCSKTMYCLLNPKRTVEGLLEKFEKPEGGSESR